MTFSKRLRLKNRLSLKYWLVLHEKNRYRFSERKSRNANFSIVMYSNFLLNSIVHRHYNEQACEVSLRLLIQILHSLSYFPFICFCSVPKSVSLSLSLSFVHSFHHTHCLPLNNISTFSSPISQSVYFSLNLSMFLTHLLFLEFFRS